MKEYYIYKHTNLIDGKCYIGMSCQRPFYKRWKAGTYINCPSFNIAIEKFGWENFSHEVLFDNLTKEEAERLEGIITLLFRSNDKRFGYNIKCGTKGSKGGIPKKAVKCIKTSIVYESATDAEKQTGIARSSISACCNGKRKTAGGSTWEFVYLIIK